VFGGGDRCATASGLVSVRQDVPAYAVWSLSFGLRRQAVACAPWLSTPRRYPLPVTAPKDSGYLIPVEQLNRAIVVIRGRRVILSHDLATAYGVTTSRLNEQVKRNARRFPPDFVFQLTQQEHNHLKSQIATSSWGGARRARPYAFTEHGAVVAACVLNTDRAVEVSVFVVRAFVRMSRMLASHRQLALKLAELESRVTVHDKNIQSLLAAIRSLITPPAPPRRRIGFATNPDDNIIAHDRPARQHHKR
jgi:hypothetical protein